MRLAHHFGPELEGSTVPVVIALGSFLMTLFGGYAALKFSDYRHLVLGLAAGLMLGVVFLDLLPEALDQAPGTLLRIPIALVLFVLGFLFLHIIERSTAVHRGHEDEYHRHSHGQGVGLLAASALVGHSVMDGFAIGAGFQAGTTVGAVVAVAVIAHDFADGFNTFTITTLYGNNRRRALIMLSADALAPVAGAAATLLFRIPPETLGGYLGFFGGVLLYLATSDILPEAHAGHPNRLTLLFTVLGTAIMFVVIAAAG